MRVERSTLEALEALIKLISLNSGVKSLLPVVVVR